MVLRISESSTNEKEFCLKVIINSVKFDQNLYDKNQNLKLLLSKNSLESSQMDILVQKYKIIDLDDKRLTTIDEDFSSGDHSEAKYKSLDALILEESERDDS